eukprot:jgi/Ulvmu1/12619/UM093_0011.1
MHAPARADFVPARLCCLLLHALPCIIAMKVPTALLDQPSMPLSRLPRGDGHAWAPIRRLLHGSGPWARCNACSLVICNRYGACTGHCRRNGRKHNCAGNTNIAGDGSGSFLAFATAPYIGCSVTPGCHLPSSGIAPHGGLPVAQNPDGTALASCESPLGDHGACMCTYHSADGNDEHRALCAATAEYEAVVPRFAAYEQVLIDEYGVSAEVVLGGQVQGGDAVTFVTVVEEPMFVDEVVKGGVVTGVADDDDP